jgi:dynein heavy chain 2
MDSLILSSSFGDELADAPLPIKITGLLMQGATYEDGRIELSGAGASELCTMTGCTLAFTQDISEDHGKSGRDNKGSGSVLDVPLYFSPTREKLLTAIAVDTKGQSDDWIIAGVALFLDSE